MPRLFMERKKTDNMSITRTFLGELTNNTSLTTNWWMGGYSRQRQMTKLAVAGPANFEE